MMDGNQEYIGCLSDLIFGDKDQDRIYGAHTIGGTGAVRIAGEFLSQEVTKTIFISNASWPNYRPIFTRCGMDVDTYSYYDDENKKFDFEGMLKSIEEMPAGSCIVLQPCCHNPTGFDPSFEQWKEIASLIKEREILPFFDCAYHGFGDGLDEDLRVVNHFFDMFEELVVCYSCSKNFGLYGERVGALFVISSGKNSSDIVCSQVRSIIRQNYSSPPVSGARLVAKILGKESLRKEWEIELGNMRERLINARKSLMEKLVAKEHICDFSFMGKQKGFFSFCGLDKDQVECLREDYGIYMPSNGRINVAAISPKNVDYVVDSILAVL